MSAQIPTNQQNQVLALIATGSTLSAAAETAGIHRNTLANWRRSQPAFKQEFEQAQFEQAMHWRDQMQSLGAIAVDAIPSVLTDKTTTLATRLKAALAVLNHLTKPAPAPKHAKPKSRFPNYPDPADLENTDRKNTDSETKDQPCTTESQPIENTQPWATSTEPPESGLFPLTPQMPIFVGPLADFKRRQWRVQHGLPAKVAK